MRVVIAEDESTARQLLERALTDWGHEPVSASDGVEAWKILQGDSSPKLAILDWGLPGMDGVEICRRMRQKAAIEPAYIILLTARNAKADVVTALRAGANDYVTKPFDREELQARLNVGRQVVELQHVLASRVQMLHKSYARVQDLSRQLLMVQEDERRHLARELHDEIGQVLSAISVNLKVVKTKVDASAWARLEESIGLVDRAVEQVRNLSLDLRPSMLDEFGLEAALRWYVDRLAERTGLTAHFDSETSVGELPYLVRTACFRVVQETLTNVVRHAHAKEVWVTLQGQEKEVRVEIRDDGIGFKAEARNQGTRDGLGLLGIRERVELLGGQVDIESKRKHGTTVQVRLPLEGSPEDGDVSEEG
jgi:signal transduction histidine kinase